MVQSMQPVRFGLISRSALGLALALGGIAGGLAISAPAMAQKAAAAPKLKLSKPFQAIAAPLQAGIEAAKVAPAYTAAKAAYDGAVAAQRAATTAAARTQTAAQVETARAAMSASLAPQKTQLDQAFAAIANEDDRFMAGSMAVNLGGMASEQSLQRRGLESMLQSGKVAAGDVGRFQYFVGQIAYGTNDFSGARTWLERAIAGGYRDNDAEGLLAEAYINDNQVPQGLTILKTALDARRAAGNLAPVNWYRRGLGAAYKAKLLDKAAEFAMALAQAYPTAENWGGAITVVREIGRFPAQETLDLMRLMGRTNSYTEERDYIEYLQAADARRLPGEVLKVIEVGTSTGKLRGSDPFVAEARMIANQRIAADRASLVTLERDARLGSANAATIIGAADAFLSYGDAAKAESLYTLALPKAGTDSARVLTRLGIAQVDLGKYAEAQTTLARVDGARKPIAQLWSLFAGQKAAKPS